MQQNQVKPLFTGGVRVQRVTLPRYEVEYQRRQDAHRDAVQMNSRGVVLIPHIFPDAPGTELVIDLQIRGQPFRATLLFRVLGTQGPSTILEWWARRQTDPALLELWLHTVEIPTAVTMEHRKQTKQTHELMDLCRRTLGKNPFTNLDIHWSCTGVEVAEAARTILSKLSQAKKEPSLPPQVTRMLDQAEENVRAAHALLMHQKGRQSARKRFIASHQLTHAIELLESKIDIARLRGQDKDLREAVIRLNELQR